MDAWMLATAVIGSAATVVCAVFAVLTWLNGGGRQ